MSAELVETPDVNGAFPRLSEPQIGTLEARGERRPVADGDVLYREGDPSYDFIVVLAGLVETFEEFAGEDRRIAVHGPGRFLGELNLLVGGSPLVTAVARDSGAVLVVTPEALRQALTDDPAFGDLILRAYLLRRTLLIELGVGNKLIGSNHSPDTRRLRTFLARNRVPHEWIDLDHDELAERVLVALGVAPEETPIVICRRENVLRNPTIAEVAAELGLRPTHSPEPSVDLLVVGAGPAGLAASVYGASEGLRTVTIDAVATGGQAAMSSRIENYLGFPTGLSGDELAERAELQARKFGATILVPGEATSIAFEEHGAVVQLADGERFAARSVVLATGARYRRLEVPRLEELEGNGVYYAATLMELQLCLNRQVVVVGGGNSAGQATLFFSEYATRVWLVARENELGENMSRYLVDRIERAKRVDVLLHTDVRELLGDEELTGVVVEDNRTGERRTLETNALFVFIGADPCTGWLAAALELDRSGYLLTGHELGGVPMTGSRDPFLLETSRRGVFAAGDVRSGSVKRVAAAVGEGAMAVQFVHRYLAAPGA